MPNINWHEKPVENDPKRIQVRVRHPGAQHLREVKVNTGKFSGPRTVIPLYPRLGYELNCATSIAKKDSLNSSASKLDLTAGVIS